VVILLELLAGGVLQKKQLGEILEVVDRLSRKRVKPVRGCFLQTEGEDPSQDGVIPSIDHHLVLILDMLNCIAQIGVAAKERSHNLFGNSHLNMLSKMVELEAFMMMVLCRNAAPLPP